jgi:glycosyltransferase involved in cell wall biosynthesis
VSDPQVSVVVPTHNRWAQLARVLEGYREQRLPADRFEVLVCDDASDDDTPARVEAFAAGAPYRLRSLRQEKRGPAAARNLGAGAARAPLLVFTDDDCVPDPALLEAHLATTRAGVATIGRIEWHPDLAVTPFMAFLSPGYRFNFEQIADPSDATYRCFYTANVSAWRDDLLAAGGFDEGFPSAAHEDIDLGLRLEAGGMRLAYDPRASVEHSHPIDLASAIHRMRGVGAAQALQERLGALAEQHHVPQLDLLVAADHVRQLEQLEREIVRLGREQRQRLVDHRLVLADQRALRAAHLRVAEQVEPRAA